MGKPYPGLVFARDGEAGGACLGVNDSRLGSC